jgi:hypothetical protein
VPALQGARRGGERAEHVPPFLQVLELRPDDQHPAGVLLPHLRVQRGKMRGKREKNGGRHRRIGGIPAEQAAKPLNARKNRLLWKIPSGCFLDCTTSS